MNSIKKKEQLLKSGIKSGEFESKNKDSQKNIENLLEELGDPNHNKISTNLQKAIRSLIMDPTSEE